jgi:RNA polymerase sigma-70 factor (ECF subfamily)
VASASSAAAQSSEDALLARARAGDEDAFRLLTDPYVRGLHVHCYRLLGSLHDAEDLHQETLLRAWRRLGGFQGRSSFRTWLYKIATNACLDALDQRSRRLLPDAYAPPDDPAEPPAPPEEEAMWVEPYPDGLLDPSGDGDPAARYDALESIELAFVAAMQCLSPLQRAVLILRDVLGFSAREAAAVLETSATSVNSALRRARATLERRLPADARSESALAQLASGEASLLARFVRAWDDADVDGLVALLREDAILTMPPTPSWYAGRRAIATFFSTVFAGELGGRLRLAPTRANGQPAFAVYLRDPAGDVHRAFALKVLTLRSGEIAAITGFGDPSLFPLFGLPAERAF